MVERASLVENALTAVRHSEAAALNITIDTADELALARSKYTEMQDVRFYKCLTCRMMRFDYKPLYTQSFQ